MPPFLKGLCIYSPSPRLNLSHMVQAWYGHVSWRRGICSAHSSTVISDTLATNTPVMHASTTSIPVRTNMSRQKLCSQASPSRATCPSFASLQPSAPWRQASTPVQVGGFAGLPFAGGKIQYPCKRLQCPGQRCADARCASSLGKQNLAWQDGTEAAHTSAAHPCHPELHRPGEEARAARGEGLAERKLSYGFGAPATHGRRFPAQTGSTWGRPKTTMKVWPRI